MSQHVCLLGLIKKKGEREREKGIHIPLPECIFAYVNIQSRMFFKLRKVLSVLYQPNSWYSFKLV